MSVTLKLAGAGPGVRAAETSGTLAGCMDAVGWPKFPGGGAGGRGDGLRFGAGGALLKPRVKLPAADAESETPGVENPLCRIVLPVGRPFVGVVAAWGTAARSGAELSPPTKIRVNSPGLGLGFWPDRETLVAMGACGDWERASVPNI
jgi:hypothetical protein